MAETENNSTGEYVDSEEKIFEKFSRPGNKFDFIDNIPASATLSNLAAKRKKLAFARQIKKNEALVYYNYGKSNELVVKRGFSFFPIAADAHIVDENERIFDFPACQVNTSDDIPVVVNMNLKIKVIDPALYFSKCSNDTRNESMPMRLVAEGGFAILRRIVQKFPFDKITKSTTEIISVQSNDGTYMNMTADEYIQANVNYELKGLGEDYGLSISIASFQPIRPTRKYLEAKESEKTQETLNRKLISESKAKATARENEAAGEAKADAIKRQAKLEILKQLSETGMLTDEQLNEAILFITKNSFYPEGAKVVVVNSDNDGFVKSK